MVIQGDMQWDQFEYLFEHSPKYWIAWENLVIRTGASEKKHRYIEMGLSLEYLMSSWAPWFLKAMNSSKTSFSAPGQGHGACVGAESRIPQRILRECQ